MSRISVRFVFITPAMAAEMLKRNTRNRPISRVDVERYRRDLEGGFWITTHQGVAFALDQTLIDGQHRLTAIVESGVGAEMPVFEGLSLDAIAVIDDHRVRRVRDRVAIMDREIPSLGEVACLKALVRGASKSTSSRKTQQEELTMFRDHIGAVRFAMGLMAGAGSGQKRAPVPGCIARASYTVDHAELKTFCDVLVSGIVRSDRPEDATIIVLRDYLASFAGSGSAGQAVSSEIYRKTSRALDAWLKRQHLKRLYESPVELFPLPGHFDSASRLKAV